MPSNYPRGLSRTLLSPLDCNRGGGMLDFSDGRFQSFGRPGWARSDSPLTLYFDRIRHFGSTAKEGDCRDSVMEVFTAIDAADSTLTTSIKFLRHRQQLWMGTNEGSFGSANRAKRIFTWERQGTHLSPLWDRGRPIGDHLRWRYAIECLAAQPRQIMVCNIRGLAVSTLERFEANLLPPPVVIEKIGVDVTVDNDRAC